MGVPTAQRQADILKDRGNMYFKKEKLGAAIDAYTEAITLCPNVPVYWTNRALCERKRNEWEKVESDCRKALELDSHSVKAYYMLGLALLQHQQYEEAVKQLEKALDLGRGASGSYMVEEIWQELAKARYAEWEADFESRQRQQEDLKFHLAELLRRDYERQLNEATASIRAGTLYSPTQRPIPMEVEDQSRVDSGPRQGNDNEKQADNEVNTKCYSDAELRRLYRTASDSLRSARSVDQSHSFDPLKHHKLSLRRGSRISARPQGNHVVSDHVEMPSDAAAASRREDSATQAAAVPEIEMKEPAPPQAMHVEGENGKSTFLEVFRDFKEFMKLQQHEAGKKLLGVCELYQRRATVLEQVFERVAAPDMPGDIPDHLCCKITMEILRDPVITPSGITYERGAILDHLRKVGKFDPVTRAQLTESQLVPNLALKEAVQAFLNEHGWAYGPY